MTPSPDATFWQHVPAWMWPIILAGVLGLFVYEAIKASETIARIFGAVGRRIHERAISPRRHLDRIEEILVRTSDRLDCATAYLVQDAEYHHVSDILIAENCPGVSRLLPHRVSFTEFSGKWSDGWRP